MKRKLFIALGAAIVLLLATSCATLPKNTDAEGNGTVPVVNGAVDGKSKAVDVSQLQFPVAWMNFGVFQEFQSRAAGTVLSTFDPLPPVDFFADPVVTVCEKEYQYKGVDYICEYQLVNTGVAAIHVEGPIQTGDILGYSTREQVGFIVRTKELSPYLVTSSTIIPVYYDGYWYFYPAMFDSRPMKWMNYYPADYEAFRYMYNYTCVPESDEFGGSFGTSYFNWKMYLETSLDAYPEILSSPIASNGVQIESAMDLDWNGMPLRLWFQPNFRSYLLDEYTLGDPIVLYLDIDTISFFEPQFNCWVRDFAFQTPDQMADRIIEELEKTVSF